MWKKIQQTMFAWVCKLQTPKPEYGCKTKVDSFFGWKIDTLVGQIMIFLKNKKKIENHLLDFVKNRCF